jgi:phospholipid N-methyltransferase
MRHWMLCGNFFGEFRRQFRNTGSVLPSSRYLAKALVSELSRPREPARILEVGPGTGSVTVAILKQLLPSDHFDLVEINKTFVDVLQRRIDHEDLFRKHHDQIHLVHAPVQELLGDGVYDYIVSGLPLNNFSSPLVRRIFRTYERLLKPGGTLTYYEYVFVRQLKSTFVNRRERLRLRCLSRVVSDYIRSFQFRRQPIMVNVPPAIVRHLRFKPSTNHRFHPALLPASVHALAT